MAVIGYLKKLGLRYSPTYATDRSRTDLKIIVTRQLPVEMCVYKKSKSMA